MGDVCVGVNSVIFVLIFFSFSFSFSFRNIFSFSFVLVFNHFLVLTNSSFFSFLAVFVFVNEDLTDAKFVN